MRSKQSFTPTKVILVVPSYSSFRLPIIDALKNLHVKVFEFDNRRTKIYEKFIFAASLANKKFYEYGLTILNKRLVNFVNKISPDLVIVIKGENILDTSISSIRQLSIIVNWFSDYLFELKNVQKQIGLYSYFFHPEMREVRKLRKTGIKNIFYLPFSSKITRINILRKKYNITFVGTFSHYRENILNPLKDKGLSIWGDSLWKGSTLAKNFQGKWLNQNQMKKTFSQSRIVINIHRGTMSNSEGTNLRTFEVAGTGAFLLTDYRKSLDDLFKIGSEIVCFKDKNDLFKKVDFYLKNENTRNKIASAGHLRVKKDHSYEKRLMKMFSVVNSKSLE